MKVLVIGAKGFIGSYAYQFLKKHSGFDCYGCDVAVDYADANYFVVNTAGSDFEDIFVRQCFDVCINCSGAASVPDSLVHPLRDFNLNTVNVFRILDLLRKYMPTCKFINLSSAAVYGNPQRIPIDESDVANPVSPYGRHKLMAESICDEYYRFFGLPVCSLRIFSAYGPGLKKQLLWDLSQKCRAGDQIQLFGTGLETRDFIYVEDIIRAIYYVILRGSFDASVYNVASGVEVSVRTIAETLLNLLGYNGDILFSGTTRKGDPLNWRADVDRLKAIGFTTTVSVDEGILKYVEWLKEEKLV